MMLKKIMKCTTRCYIVNKGLEKLPSHLLSALSFFTVDIYFLRSILTMKCSVVKYYLTVRRICLIILSTL